MGRRPRNCPETRILPVPWAGTSASLPSLSWAVSRLICVAYRTSIMARASMSLTTTSAVSSATPRHAVALISGLLRLGKPFADAPDARGARDVNAPRALLPYGNVLVCVGDLNANCYTEHQK